MVSRQPRSRSVASIESPGPATWAMSRWPRAMRCSVAVRAPAYWSIESEGARPPARLDDHDRHPHVQAGQGVEVADARGHHDEGLDVLAEDEVDGGADRLGLRVDRGGQRDRVVGGTGRREQAQHGAARPVVGGAGGDQPDGARTGPDHGPRRGAGTVAELLDRALDALPGRLAHARVVVDHARHGLVRHAGEPGDVEDRRRGAGARDGRAAHRASRRRVAAPRPEPDVTANIRGSQN